MLSGFYLSWEKMTQKHHHNISQMWFISSWFVELFWNKKAFLEVFWDVLGQHHLNCRSWKIFSTVLSPRGVWMRVLRKHRSLLGRLSVFPFWKQILLVLNRGSRRNWFVKTMATINKDSKIDAGELYTCDSQ